MGAVAIPVVLVMLRMTSVVPRSVLILYPPVLILLMAGSRFTYRVWKEHRLYSPLAALGEPVLILGAGEAGARLAKELTHSRKWRIVGLLDDNPAKQGRLLRNISVLGPIAELPLWAKRFGVRTVILALAFRSPRRAPSRGRALRGGGRRGVDGALVRGSDQRPLAADDHPARRARRPARPRSRGARQRGTRRLAGRPRGDGNRRRRIDRRGVVPPDRAIQAGAARAARSFRIRPLSDSADCCRTIFPSSPLATLVGDVKHGSLIDQVLAIERPSVLFHAAAYKHVPLMEESNAWQAVRNNAWGTWVLARAAVAARVEKFVLVSTDKAVNPTNVMGASKRMAEMVCQSLQNGHDAVRHRAFRQCIRQHR